MTQKLDEKDWKTRCEEFKDDKNTHRSWIFTHNNYTEKDFQMYCDFDALVIAVGKEVGSQGTPHLQGYITFHTAYRLSGLKKISPKCFWAVAIRDDYNYCLKDQNYFIKDKRKQGTRKDWLEVRDLAKEGKFSDISSIHTAIWCKCENSLRNLHKIRNTNLELRTTYPIVIWLCGSSGKGKTRYVFQAHNIQDIWKTGNLYQQFYNNYENQEVALFDDIRWQEGCFRSFIELTDCYPLDMNVKNSSRNFNSKFIYITTPKTPEEFFSTDINRGEEFYQIYRRITKIILFSGDSVTVTEVSKG